MNLLKYHSFAILVDDKKVISKVNQIINKLENNDYKVVCINKNSYNTLDSKSYESLKDVPYNIDIVIIISLTVQIYEILDEMELLDIDSIWFEKGSYNEEITKKAKELKLNTSYDSDLYNELKKY